MKASTLMGGKSDTNMRHPSDLYSTPWECTQALVAHPQAAALLRLDTRKSQVWEPACGKGFISDVLFDLGYSVLNTDIVNHGYPYFHTHLDFTQHVGRTIELPATGLLPTFEYRPSCIITNPPFDRAEDFIRVSHSTGLPFAMLLKATFWNVPRDDLFRDTQPNLHLPLAWRPAMAPERGASATMDFAWTVWGTAASPHCTFDVLRRPVNRAVKKT